MLIYFFIVRSKILDFQIPARNFQNWDAIENITSMNLEVLPLPNDFGIVVENCKKYRILTKDSLHVSVMELSGLDDIASNDPDFSRVSWINLYNPERTG